MTWVALPFIKVSATKHSHFCATQSTTGWLLNIALHLESDPDLAALHSDPRFSALVAHAKERAAAAQKPN
jgi:hypothetical protein